ncbi:MAG TPA: lipoyl synthase [Rhabdochlamydiaceae bacterium]|jgi:lipoic acid synthetase|nr:lipoyl synthase [Rhabdochlamydiaceae bacterium]
MTEENVFDARPAVKLKVLNKLPENPEPEHGRFPSWLHRQMPRGGSLFKTDAIVKKYSLNTVCEEAKCPNRLHCYSHKTATFLALGKACTRSCGFCDIDFTKQPLAPEQDEPERIACSVQELGLKHVVVTMVARDDLPDGGAAHMAEIIRSVRAKNHGCTIEVLTSDFNGNLPAMDKVLDERPEVFNHNIETVRAMTPRVRHKATYDRTLSVLKYAKESGKAPFVKSGLMVGLGETEEQVLETLQDLKSAGCDIVTIGHYLQADRRKLTVKSFITPEQFKRYEEYGYSLGIQQMYSGPFVRSSFNAGEVKMLAATKKINDRL